MSPNTARKSEEDKCGIWSASGEPDPSRSRCHQSNKMESDDEQNLAEIKKLILCGHCHQPFNDTTLLPKDLECKHTFCLDCIQSGLSKGTVSKGSSMRSGELFCDLCWKLTELSEMGPQALQTNTPKLALVKLYMKLKGGKPMTNGNAPNKEISLPQAEQLKPCPDHGFPLGLWCINCKQLVCTGCQQTLHADPSKHEIWTQEQAKEQMKQEAMHELSSMVHMDDTVRQLARRQRQFLILIRNACTSLMREVQSTLDSDWNIDPTAEIREALTQINIRLSEATTPEEVHDLFSVMISRKPALEAKCHEMMIQCQLNDLIGHAVSIFDFDTLHQAVAGITSSGSKIKPHGLQEPVQDPVLFLTNYCMSLLYSRLPPRLSNDSFGLNHNMQLQLILDPPNLPTNHTPSPLPEQQQTLSRNGLPESFTDSNDCHIPQVKYPKPIQPPVPTPFEAHVEISRPPTPPDTLSSASTSQASLNSFSSATATAQVMPMLSMVNDEQPELSAPIIHPPMRPVPIKSPANVSPRYFFNISINGVAKGQIIIETRPDVAPKMCRNFDRLTTADRRQSYKGCSFFQCWKNESVITGDFEFNTGRGGRSIYENEYFHPDETRLPAVRGTVGMRRQQRKHDFTGAVGSQFRIILQDTQAFTGIFGHVVEGIELVDTIASHGDQTGKPVKPITITRCGKL